MLGRDGSRRGVARVFAGLAMVVAVVGCHRSASLVAAHPDAQVSDSRPAVTCMVYRRCGCTEGCSGIAIPSDELRVGLTATVIAGMACGDTVMVENALGVEGRMTTALGSTGECQERCGMTAMQPVDNHACEGACDRCGR